MIDEILGYTRYRIEGRVDDPTDDDDDVDVTVSIVDRGGLSRELRSRTDENPMLRGTKHRVATERLVLLAHHPSDVLAGALNGVLGAMVVRYWFAARASTVMSLTSPCSMRP